MGSRTKLKKFEAIEKLPNVFKYQFENTDTEIEKFLSKKENIILELGCGEGDYTVSLAKKYPQKIFMGIDIKSSRIYSGAIKALEEKLDNATFLSIYIEEIEQLFSNKKIDEIWLTFPDPYLKKKKIKKRLTSPRFLNIYKNILQRNGIIHLKTDNITLYKYTLEVLSEENAVIERQTEDLYSEANILPDEEIKTKYEKKYLEEGKTIKLISFRFGN